MGIDLPGLEPGPCTDSGLSEPLIIFLLGRTFSFGPIFSNEVTFS